MSRSRKQSAPRSRKGNGRKKQQNKGSAKLGAHVGTLSTFRPHTQAYLAALSNPMSAGCRGVGSVINAMKSQKASARMFWNIATDPDRHTFVFVLPCINNDQPSLWHVVTTDLGDTYNGTVWTANEVNSYKSFATLPYSNADVTQQSSSTTSGVRGRVISLGLKVTCLSSPLTREGEVVWYEQPAHDPLFGSVDSASFDAIVNLLNSLSTARRVSFAGIDEHIFGVSPHDHLECTLQPRSTAGLCYDYPWSVSGMKMGPTGSATAHGNPIAVLYFPPNSSSQGYRVESQIHVEYMGNRVDPFSTLVHEDTENGHTIRAAVMDAKQEHSEKPHRPLLHGVFEKVTQELKSRALSGGMSFLKKEVESASPATRGMATMALAALM